LGIVCALILSSYLARADRVAPDKIGDESDSALSSDTYDIAKKALLTDSQAVKDKVYEYRLNRTSIETRVVYNVHTGRDVGEEGRFFKGTDPRVLLKGAEFYSHIGEKGLARWYHGKTILRHVLRWGGVATMGFAAYWTWNRSRLSGLVFMPTRTLAIGGTIFGIGGAVAVTSMFIGKEIRSLEEKSELSREYNRKLRKRLGLTKEDVSLRIENDPILPDRQKNIRKLRWSLVPTVTDTAGGLSFAVVF